MDECWICFLDGANTTPEGMLYDANENKVVLVDFSSAKVVEDSETYDERGLWYLCVTRSLTHS